ncbi:MAG TPA: MerR family transcriptional regulator [Thermoanaerobacterales bacterium]|nr:MerR family transcriptional regulator [Thermoanaerobacterales bacterium]
METKTYTLKQIAKMCDVKPSNLYKWLRKLGLEFDKVGGKLCFTETDLLVINKVVELREEGLTLREIGEHLKPGKFTFTREDALKLALHDNIATLKQIAEEVSIQKDMLHRQNRNVAVLEHKLEELAATKETPPWWRRLFRGL